MPLKFISRSEPWFSLLWKLLKNKNVGLMFRYLVFLLLVLPGHPWGWDSVPAVSYQAWWCTSGSGTWQGGKGHPSILSMVEAVFRDQGVLAKNTPSKLIRCAGLPTSSRGPSSASYWRLPWSTTSSSWCHRRRGGAVLLAGSGRGSALKGGEIRRQLDDRSIKRNVLRT